MESIYCFKVIVIKRVKRYFYLKKCENIEQEQGSDLP